jgi:hypothetical protein
MMLIFALTATFCLHSFDANDVQMQAPQAGADAFFQENLAADEEVIVEPVESTQIADVADDHADVAEAAIDVADEAPDALADVGTDQALAATDEPQEEVFITQEPVPAAEAELSVLPPVPVDAEPSVEPANAPEADPVTEIAVPPDASPAEAQPQPFKDLEIDRESAE